MPDYKLEDCVKIEPMALEEEFVRLPADLSYWNQLYADAYQLWLESKVGCKTLYAQLYVQIKTQLQMTSKGRVTEAEVENSIALDEGYINAQMREIQTESDKVRLYGVMDAIRSKRDMLISVGAMQRAEMQNDPTIRRQAAIGREVEQGRAGRSFGTAP